MVGQKLIRLLQTPQFLPLCVILTVTLRGAILMVPIQQTSDYLWYFLRAAGIAGGEGYHQNGVLTAFWPVGWPAALGALFSITGPSVLAGQLFNVALAVVACLMTAFLGRALFSRAAGNLAALLIAIYPNQIAYVPLLSVEIFYEVLFLIGVYLLMSQQVLPTLLAGVVFGVATLTKTQTLILPGFLFLWMFLTGPSYIILRKYIILACATYITLLLIVLPWSYRNWTVFNEIIPVSTNGGWTLLTGNNPEANGDYSPDTTLAENINHTPEDQVAMDKLARDRAVGWIEANPGRFIWLLPQKFLHLWAYDGEADWYYQKGLASYERNAKLIRVIRILNQGYYFLLWGLAIPSMFRPRHSGSPWVHTGIAMAAFITLLSLVFSGQARFHFVLMPFIAMHAAWTVTQIITGSKQKSVVVQPEPG